MNESAGLSDPLDWRTVTAAGDIPRALAVPAADRLTLLEDYLETFARRDFREVLAIDSPERLEQLLRLLGARTGTELNVANLARDLGQSVSTVRRWIGALERSYLITLVPPFSRNSSARVIKSPKMFMVDSALAQAAAGDRSPSGFHFETLVLNDLLVWRDDAAGRSLFHWRIPSGPEADFILAQDHQIVPVEIKCADSISRQDGRHLSLFLAGHPEAVIAVLLSGDPAIRWIRERVLATPWWSVL